MYTNRTQLRVRYGETDQMAYVYYGQYAYYYEVGRVEALRNLGLSYKSMEDDLGIFMPVMSMNVKYIRPAFYDEMLDLETSIEKIPEMTIQFHTKIYNPTGKLINYGLVSLCFVEIKSRQRVIAPQVITEKLKTFFEG
ncbi:MAG: YbgC/FadM family acyl-CoA thioesterase [Saprospiraceae bacterium]|nr:YbgC/FadM family acyl-CoA thioesterase [Saprospiraceae bacterium]HMW38859.1 YbgC/FadM family acyl-CoA thioesterase [Saprospiraceae bacterium]HMX87852.1 YbgC/FadM family acyl-CoA thioesterase [Saprospiraceae bacterium]HMZ39700.1 YbgC/FadM family acyl-CoA thioesterase [Saprospiraceae bacterium]HNA64236.1 YbgC/FadM family acyl-CoA thioesterase [Saprospiraceae bacterium]